MSARPFRSLARPVLSALLCLAPFAAPAQPAPSPPDDRSQASLIAALRTELPPGTAVVGFGDWTQTPVAPAIALLDGTALLDLGAAEPVPVRFHATFDTTLQDVISFSYRLEGAGVPAPEQDAALSRKVAERIDARLDAEFSQQPVQFSLLELTAIRHTPRGIIMQGHGVADFAHEGSADVTFIATFDRETATLHALQYELATPASEAEWTATAARAE